MNNNFRGFWRRNYTLRKRSPKQLHGFWRRRRRTTTTTTILVGFEEVEEKEEEEEEQQIFKGWRRGFKKMKREMSKCRSKVRFENR